MLTITGTPLLKLAQSAQPVIINKSILLKMVVNAKKVSTILKKLAQSAQPVIIKKSILLKMVVNVSMIISSMVTQNALNV